MKKPSRFFQANGFLAFLAFKVALKVSFDLEFEICDLCSLCKPIVSHLYSCFGLLFELSQKKKKNV